MSYSEFKAQVLGKGYDIDGSYGFQCWDGYAKYCQYLGVPFANCTVTGYVRDIWEQRQANSTLNYFDEVSDLQEGDVVVFKVVSGWTPYSHIAIFDSDAGGGYGWFLGQNQGGAAGANGGAVFNLAKLPYSATYDTGFRLKGTSQKTVVEEIIKANKKGENFMFNYVMRSNSGAQGYVGCINGNTFGIGSIDTVDKLQEAGFTHLWLDDGDFNRIVQSQNVSKDTLKAALENVANTIKSK